MGMAGGGEKDEESDGDIEKSIQKELSEQKTTPRLFEYVHLDLPCLLFFKTRAPVDPVDLVHRICKEVVANPDIRKMKYINRLSPVSVIVKANEKGLEELASIVLAKHFQLSESENEQSASKAEESNSNASPPSVSLNPRYLARPIY